ncbi:MAG TPA: permease [Chloroflexia bacterium]|nr:permease [Chloroflexia bacterium]
MLAGHFGLAAAVKARQTQLPIWSLMLATQLLDVIFLFTYTFGIESYKAVEGTSGGYGNLIFTADYTHSLVGAFVLSVLAVIVTWIFWGRRNGLVIGVMVFSHWLIDFVVHRADLPILPGNAGDLPRLGLGLWQISWVVAAIELGMCLAGAWLYYHASARAAIQAERKRAKAGESPAGYRQNALIASIALTVFLLATLAGDVFLNL